MPENNFHIRIKKQYVAALIEDLVKVHAIEVIPEDKEIDLTELHRAALEKEVAQMASSHAYIKKWNDFKHRLKNR